MEQKKASIADLITVLDRIQQNEFDFSIVDIEDAFEMLRSISERDLDPIELTELGQASRRLEELIKSISSEVSRLRIKSNKVNNSSNAVSSYIRAENINKKLNSDK